MFPLLANNKSIDSIESEAIIEGISVIVFASLLVQTFNPAFISYLSLLSGAKDWLSKWFCIDCFDTEEWLSISGYVSIFLVYLSVSIILFWFLRKLQPVSTKWSITLFIVSLCGFIYVMDVISSWQPIYHFREYVELISGGVSIATISVLSVVIPKRQKHKSPTMVKKEIDERIKIQNQFELFVKYSPGAVAMFDVDMRYLIVNDGWYKDYELIGENIIGKSHYEVFPMIKNMPYWVECHRKALNGETLKKKSDSFYYQDKTQYLNWELRPWYNPDDSIGGVIMFTENITKEILAEKRLKESEMRFANIFNQAMVGIALVDEKGTPFLVNERFSELLEYSREELLEMNFQNFTHTSDLELSISRFQKLIQGEINDYTVEKRYITKTGKTKYVKLNTSLVDEGIGSKYALVIVEDVTPREVERQQKEKMMKLFTEISSLGKIGTWEIDVLSNSLQWSDVIYDIHEEDRGKKILIEKAINYHHEEHRPVITKAIEVGMTQKEPWDLELKVKTVKGKEKWVRTIGRPIIENEQTVKIQGLLQDIDLKKKYELEINKSRKNLEELVNKRTLDLKTANEELEAFSYSVSHDLRAPLRAINGYAEALIEDHTPILPGDAVNYLSRISANSKKMEILIDDLLEFSRMNRKKVHFSQVNLKEMINAIIHDLFADSRQHIHVGDLPIVKGDEQMLNQVFVNLISNAIKYSSKEKNQKIEVNSVIEDDLTIISVKDNGVGFNMKYYDKLFNVFQRLHHESEFEGTGVGLALCYKIVKAHKGEISAESEIGKGATFSIKLKSD